VGDQDELDVDDYEYFEDVIEQELDREFTPVGSSNSRELSASQSHLIDDVIRDASRIGWADVLACITISRPGLWMVWAGSLSRAWATEVVKRQLQRKLGLATQAEETSPGKDTGRIPSPVVQHSSTVVPAPAPAPAPASETTATRYVVEVRFAHPGPFLYHNGRGCCCVWRRRLTRTRKHRQNFGLYCLFRKDTLLRALIL
jgi:hypothetical protein